MALSEEEQQLLAQMEAALAADDPKLADMLRGTGTRKVHRRRAGHHRRDWICPRHCRLGGWHAIQPIDPRANPERCGVLADAGCRRNRPEFVAPCKRCRDGRRRRR